MASIEKSSSQEISSIDPDWSREHYTSFSWQPSYALIACIRQYSKYTESKKLQARLLRKIEILKHRFWSVVTGADIPINCQIGGGLLLPHPNGVVIHPAAVIGPNCLIFQQVTIGMRNGGVPTISGHVDIGAGAKLLGPIFIGEHVNIGANAVVLSDVPNGCTVVGIPAQPISDSKYDR